MNSKPDIFLIYEYLFPFVVKYPFTNEGKNVSLS